MLGEKEGLIIAIILYVLAMFIYIMLFTSKKIRYSKYGSWLLRFGFVFHTIAILNRTVEAGRLPLASQYEFATSFAWAISLSFIVYEWKYKFKTLGIFVTPFILAVTVYAALQSAEIKPLMPVLQSEWLFFHVSTAIFSYGSFAIACAVSVVYIIREKLKDDEFTLRHLPQQEALDQMAYKAISFGFFMLTLVIVTGAIWAERAWGRYWRWDPKETWSFITWIIYAIYLHVRLNKGWKNKKAALYSVIGFAAVIFTYIGVNTLLSGFHSYL
ncbi:c-type cytochrome biogenesis protein CcsB [Tissierella sp. Yu-01]|uniref:c-type cytochrome biogenesis protein CcsB n=1 Tax=Tissierella sp. Yu-01 TaxID=3035694 RepID=UPI00240D9B1C|nr:c-type cytochrome biogenesis protein CcsB [Tissierella sp. Yu-01]WFA07804.1 c-type cytochrome biogenesis protein CcsB [Tissierella sp. Yu-01]